jgi:hypothetical protein
VEALSSGSFWSGKVCGLMHMAAENSDPLGWKPPALTLGMGSGLDILIVI